MIGFATIVFPRTLALLRAGGAVRCAGSEPASPQTDRSERPGQSSKTKSDQFPS